MKLLRKNLIGLYSNLTNQLTTQPVNASMNYELTKTTFLLRLLAAEGRCQEGLAAGGREVLR